MKPSHARLLAVLAGLASGCSEGVPGAIPTADRAVFESDVLPVLLRDCGFHACHGSSDRFFQVFGPGHGRFAPDIRPLDPITPAEIEHSFTRSLSMIEPQDLEHSLLLVKPLALAAGGAGHEGSDALGRNVYQSKDDPAYKLLHAWVVGVPFTR